jgi:glyoxylase-like metal-dependent hydrolase (beta-lactamase superfamily II)
MIVERVEHPDWLSNAYLAAEGPGGHGVFIDSNGLTESLEERAERDGITITHVLCTHGHPDHVVAIEELAGRHGVPLLASRSSPTAKGLRAKGSTSGPSTRRATVRTTSRSW